MGWPPESRFAIYSYTVAFWPSDSMIVISSIRSGCDPGGYNVRRDVR
jgi:hypothetical protein